MGPSRPLALTLTLALSSTANGIRTRVPALRGLCPGPLDDSGKRPVSVAVRVAANPRDSRGRPTTATETATFSYRPGGNRTPNPRFWRPVLYQLSYGPLGVRVGV